MHQGTNAQITNWFQFSATVKSDGRENTLYEHPGGERPIDLKWCVIDLENMTDDNALIVRVYYRMWAGGDWRQFAGQLLKGNDGGLVNGNKLVAIPLIPNQYGVKITIQQAAGTNRSYDWFVVGEA